MLAARPAIAALICVALCACAGASLGPVAVQQRPTRHVPRPPVPAVSAAESSDEVVALIAPGFDPVRLQPAAFMMGSTQAEVVAATEACTKEPLGEPELCEKREYANEMSEHDVYISGFAIDRTEVTVERYRTCAGTGVCSDLPYAEGGGRFDVPELPAVLVSWPDAQRFCRWAGGRLPTEAEWERAARGTAGRRYPWGNVYNAFLSNHGQLAWDELDASDGFLELAKVGSFPDGATPEGILDLAGNAEEWVADWYAPSYVEASVVDPKGPDAGEERVVRGGSYEHLRPSLRCAARGHAPPDERRTWRGFRCAYDAR